MKSLVILALSVLAIAIALPRRVRREAYEFPDGVELIVGPVSTSFSCEGRGFGYYADVDNNCQIFHVCEPQTLADGEFQTAHYSFFCGNQTVFDQFSLTCAYEEDAVPCRSAPDFFDLNQKIGQEDVEFHSPNDVERKNALLQGKK